MGDDEWRHQEETVIPSVEAHVDVRLVQGDELPFFGLPGLDELGTDGGLHNVGVAKVTHPEHEAELLIPHGDNRIVGKHEGLCSLLWLTDLDEHAPYHEGIDDGAKDGLDQEEYDAFWTLLCDYPEAIPDGGFSLNGEQEGRHKATEVFNTRDPLLVTNMVQITPDVSNQPPNETEEQPSDGIDHGEDKQVEAPFEVHQGGEEVAQVPVGFLDVAMVDVALATLFHVALAGLLAFR